MHIVFLSLGTNLGDKEKNLKDAIALIQRRIGSVETTSAFFETEPWGFISSYSFLNAAVKVKTSLSPYAVLQVTQDIERELGRTRKSVDGIYHDRIIDIDILMFFDDCDLSKECIRISTPELTIPHPLMNKRDFVLIPLREIL